MSCLAGYFILATELSRWLDAAQSQPSLKNKVRKDLWTNFIECIRYYVEEHEYSRYIRIPRGHFITLQSFCMMDGRGQETLNNDQLLSFITTLDQLRLVASQEEAAKRNEIRNVKHGDVDEEQKSFDSGRIIRK